MPPKSWAAAINPELIARLNRASIAAFHNATDLEADAELLRNASRHSRALALAILAEEEFAKCIVLRSAANSGRWDSVLYDALHRHGKKQSLAEAMRQLSSWLGKQSMQRNDLLPTGMVPTVTQSKLNELLAPARKLLETGLRDKWKQDALYVSIDREARVRSKPSVFDANDIKPYFASLAEIRTLAEALLGAETRRTAP